MAAYVLVSEVLEQLELTVGSLGKDGRAEGLHDLLDGDILVGELIARGAVLCQLPPRAILAAGITHQTRPNAPMPTGCKSEYLCPPNQPAACFFRLALMAHSTCEGTAAYLEVISNVVPKIWARTNSAMATVSGRVSKE